MGCGPPKPLVKSKSINKNPSEENSNLNKKGKALAHGLKSSGGKLTSKHDWTKGFNRNRTLSCFPIPHLCFLSIGCILITLQGQEHCQQLQPCSYSLSKTQAEGTVSDLASPVKALA